MSDTPERIWLGQNMNGWIAIEYRPNWVQLPEYIRADRIEALQSEVESFRTAAAVAGPALQKALREIEALIAERDALAQKRNDAERVAGVLTLENEALQADNARRRERIQNQTDQINGLERSRRRLESLMAGADRRVELVEADNARLREVIVTEEWAERMRHLDDGVTPAAGFAIHFDDGASFHIETALAMARVQDGYARKATCVGEKVIFKANARAQRQIASYIRRILHARAALNGEETK